MLALRNRSTGVMPGGLYARLLGSSWLQLAEPVRLAHGVATTIRGHGRLRIARGGNRAARFLAALLRLPRASEAARTRVVVTSRGDAQLWDRIVDDRCLATRQYAVGDGTLGERIGVLEFRFRLEVTEGSLVFRQVGTALVWGPVRVRVPATWAPRIEAREDPAGAHQTGIYVHVVLPAVGPLLTYRGIIDFDEPPA